MSAVYRFDRFEVRPAERRVLAGGTPAVLGARAFDVLLWLIEHRARLVTKHELLEAVWPGVVVEENNLSVQISALRKVLGTATIATVPGRGFRFAADVQISPATIQVPPQANSLSTGLASQPSDKPAIAVLPFSALSSDPVDAHLCDGIVADITALLARVPGFFVISRASSFVFRDRASDLPEIARQLGVRYLVEGSLRTQGETLRISTQLTDASAGHVLWNGEFGSSRLTALGCNLGLISSWPAMTKDLVASIDVAVRLDGRNPEVLGFAGCALSDLGFHERAIEMLRDALDIDPSNAQASVALGAALVQSGKLDDGVGLMRLGMRISPRDRRLAFWGWGLAMHLLRAEHPSEALSEARIAQRRDPRFYLARIVEAGAHARLGRLDEAVAPLRRAREFRPSLTLDEIQRTHGQRVARQLAAPWAASST